jgi:hypothetical protein
MANLTKLDLTLIYPEPMLAVTENSVELTGLLKQGDSTITIPSNVAVSNTDKITVILDGVVQFGFTLNNNVINFGDSLPTDTVYKVIIPSSLSRVVESAEISAEDKNNVVGVQLTSRTGTAGVWHNITYDNILVRYSSDYFNNHPIFKNIVQEIVDGQYMIKIPKFYVKNNNHEQIWISPKKLTGFHCHPAFIKNNIEQDCFYIGKYEGSLTSGKLCSQPGATVCTNTTLATFLTYIGARNVNGVTGFNLPSVYMISAIQMLALIETKSPDAKNLIGKGNSDGSAGIEITTGTNNITASYRGIIGLWGNVWEFLSGIMVSNNILQIMDNTGTSTWKNTGLAIPAYATASLGVNCGYINKCSTLTGTNFDLKDVFIPIEYSATTSPSSYCAYFLGCTNGVDVYVCTGGSNSYQSGLFSIGFTFVAASSGAALGARLSKI